MSSADSAPSPAPTPAQQDVLEELSEAIAQALDVVSTSEVLSLITGVFVELTLRTVREKGVDANKEIFVDSGTKRAITIHPEKS